MTQGQFIQKFLPDWEKKWEDFYYGTSRNCDRLDMYRGWSEFLDIYFHDAYKNAMRKQRELCNQSALISQSKTLCAVINPYSILNAPTP